MLVILTTLLRIRVRALSHQATALSAEVSVQTRDLKEKTNRLEMAGAEKSRLLVKLEEQSREFEKLAQEDSLTGLANRRHFDQELEKQFNQSRQSTKKLAVALMDVDYFKGINDRYSHQVGDEVLKTVADLLQVACGADGTPARYGGEEFVMLFPGLDAPEASERCNNLRQALKDHDFSAIAKGLKVTISGGISDDLDVENFEKMLSNADQQLYEAKNSGRDRVCF